MSDQYAEYVASEKQDQVAPQGKSITLLITLQPNQQVEMTGPLGNDGLCYLMLEKARAHIQNMHLLKELEQKAKASNGQGIAGLLKKMGRG